MHDVTPRVTSAAGRPGHDEFITWSHLTLYLFPGKTDTLVKFAGYLEGQARGTAAEHRAAADITVCQRATTASFLRQTLAAAAGGRLAVPGWAAGMAGALADRADGQP